MNFLLSDFKLLIGLGVGIDEETLNTKFQPVRIIFRPRAMASKFYEMSHLAKI